MDILRISPHITEMTEKKRILIAITGASGAVYGLRLVEILNDVDDVETHLVISKAGRLTLSAELDRDAAGVEALADVVHLAGNVGAPVSSGSFRLDAMVVAPCSVKTASNIAYGNTGDLITRAADVMLKERRNLILAVRETPLHAGHLETLTKLAKLGAIIFPPVPAFYQKPQEIQDIVDQTCMRLLDQAGVHVETAPRWGEAGGIAAIGNSAE